MIAAMTSPSSFWQFPQPVKKLSVDATTSTGTAPRPRWSTESERLRAEAEKVAHKISKDERESFVGGYGWQRSGLGVDTPGLHVSGGSS